MSIILIGVNHKTAPVEIRERLIDKLQRMKARGAGGSEPA